MPVFEKQAEFHPESLAMIIPVHPYSSLKAKLVNKLHGAI